MDGHDGEFGHGRGEGEGVVFFPPRRKYPTTLIVSVKGLHVS